MGRRRRGEPPRYLHHKATDQGYSTWHGKTFYFGEYNTPASRRAYAELVRQWERDEGIVAVPEKERGTIAGLSAEYQAKVAVHYSRQERTDIKANFTELERQFGSLPPDGFGPKDLKTIRDTWVKLGLARQTINKQVGRIRRLFRWGVSEDLVDPATLGALTAVEDLRPGRTSAPEYGEVLPVSPWHLARSLRHMPDAVRAMCLVQYWVGARPGEVCRMRGDELHRNGWVKIKGRQIKIPAGLWAFTPEQHKNKLKDKVLIYLVGPRAQKVLTPYLTDGYLFSHLEAFGTSRGKRESQEARLDSYGKAIGTACRAAGVPEWTPNQLRHSFFSRLERHAGLALASQAGGHASIATTEIYVERNIQAVSQLAEKHG